MHHLLPEIPEEDFLNAEKIYGKYQREQLKKSKKEFRMKFLEEFQKQTPGGLPEGIPG